MKKTERHEIELLLPWYVTGKLSGEDKRRVESAMAVDAALERQLELVRAELLAAGATNEAIDAPTTLTADNLMARLKAETGTGFGTGLGAGAGWFARLLEAWTGPARLPLRLAAAAAAVLVIVQGAALFTLLLRQTDGYVTAGGPAGQYGPGTFAVMRLKDDARVADVAAMLQDKSMTIVDGPRAGGLYTVRVGDAGMSEAARDARIAELVTLSGLVVFAAPLQ